MQWEENSLQKKKIEEYNHCCNRSAHAVSVPGRKRSIPAGENSKGFMEAIAFTLVWNLVAYELGLCVRRVSGEGIQLYKSYVQRCKCI